MPVVLRVSELVVYGIEAAELPMQAYHEGYACMHDKGWPVLAAREGKHAV